MEQALPQAVVPVFFSADEPFWLSDQGWELLERNLLRMADSAAFSNIAVVSPNKAVLELVNRLELEGIKASPSEQVIEKYSPCGTFTALDALETRGGFEKHPFVVLSFRNPLITTEMIASFILAGQAEPGRILISVVEPKDNPCQAGTYCRIHAEGILHLLDRTFKLPEHLKEFVPSRPFLMNWGAMGVSSPKPGEVYSVSEERLRIKQTEPASPVRGQWLCCDKNTARRLFDKADTPGVAGIGDPILGEDDALILVEDERRGGLIVRGTALSQAEFLYAESFGPEGLSGQASGAVQGEGEYFLPLKPESGLVYTALVGVEDDGHDMYLPFLPTGGEWEVSTAGEVIRDGQRVHGRQSFPDVLQPDGSLMWITLDQGRRLYQEMNSGRVRFHLLRQTQSVNVEDLYGYLTAMAIMNGKTD